MHQMDIKGEEMYERLLSLADESYHPVKSLIDGLDPLMCKVTLIEVCRSLDYWHVMDHFSGKNPNPLSIPEFNIIRRGWNPLFALVRGQA
jgi:tRNA A37 threonylcarbamoyladenosine dehydratase